MVVFVSCAFIVVYLVVGFTIAAIVSCWCERKVAIHDQDFAVYLILWPIVLSYLFLKGVSKIFSLDYISAFKKLKF